MKVFPLLPVIGLLGFATLSSAQGTPVPQVFRSVQEQKGEWRVELEQATSLPAPSAAYTVCAEDPLAAITYAKTPSPCTQRLVKDTAEEAVEESVCPTGTSTAVLMRDGNSVILEQTSAASQFSRWRFTALGACRVSSRDERA